MKYEVGKRVILFIDTSSNLEVEIGLMCGTKRDGFKQALEKQKAQVVLTLIEKLLARNNLTPLALTGIEVVPGPGSFTGLRVGVSIANTLGTYLKIPINGEPVGKLAEPIYT